MLRTFPTLPLDDSNPEDINTHVEDHAYDALRYMVMTRTSGHASIHKSLQAIKNQTFKPMDNTFGY